MKSLRSYNKNVFQPADSKNLPVLFWGFNPNNPLTYGPGCIIFFSLASHTINFLKMYLVVITYMYNNCFRQLEVFNPSIPLWIFHGIYNYVVFLQYCSVMVCCVMLMLTVS